VGGAYWKLLLSYRAQIKFYCTKGSQPLVLLLNAVWKVRALGNKESKSDERGSVWRRQTGKKSYFRPRIYLNGV
jgi:hypothetical protein